MGASLTAFARIPAWTTLKCSPTRLPTHSQPDLSYRVLGPQDRRGSWPGCPNPMPGPPPSPKPPAVQPRSKPAPGPPLNGPRRSTPRQLQLLPPKKWTGRPLPEPPQ
jgi:hypothetical protein